LPQVRVPEKGLPLVLGTDNGRVQALRERLGLAPAGAFDAALAERVAAFQRVHGLPADGKPGALTLAALNRGAVHYERKLLMNMERARRLPAPGTAKRYILVDAGSARLWMYENGRVVDSMKVVVGAPSSATPMMAALMRFASINPYWNVPVDLVASLIAPRVVSGGTSYLVDRRYEVLESWEADAQIVDPASVDWAAVAAGKTEARVRQLPGGTNSMGAIKFMMPNEYGIYLHDTPSKTLFAGEERWVSNGCVRLEDAGRLARWIFGGQPRPTHPDREDHLQLYEPMPVYITYLTAAPDGTATLFRPDPYERDAKVLARFADKDSGMRDARPPLMIDLDASPSSGQDGKAAKSAPSKRQIGGKPTSKSPRPSKMWQPPAIAAQQGRGFRVVTPVVTGGQKAHSGAKRRS
jgi:murein L,D-transpeptidase YcbB/YkuD